MQEIEEKEEQQPELAPATDPESQPLIPLAFTQEDDDDPEIIFIKAVAEIDTQPLMVRREPLTIGEVLEICLLINVLCFSFMGIAWQCIMYPHTLVVLYTKAHTASITTTLDLQTRTVAPITLTRSATIATTGQGRLKARAAAGQLTFYNGSYVSQTLNAGTVYTGRNGVQVALLQPVIIPAASPPQFGEANATAQALNVGAEGNIAAYDITLALSNFLTVKNLASFTGGKDARTYRAVAAQDLTALATTVSATLTQAFINAFPLQPGEQDLPTNCTTKATPNHQTGGEAQTITLTIAKTCSAVAYNSQQLEKQATTAFRQTQPGKQYIVVGSVQTILKSVSPLTVTLSGNWAYTFSQDYQDFLAREIQGASPAKARAYLLKIGVISYASVPATLPSADYINFLVLVG